MSCSCSSGGTSWRRCCCPCTCPCSCSSCDVEEDTSTPETPTVPTLAQFPVYVSYPAFFAGDGRIAGANQAIFLPGVSRFY